MSRRPAEATGKQDAGARGKHMFPLPLGPSVAQITPGVLPHWLSEVHQGTALGAGYIRLSTP